MLAMPHTCAWPATPPDGAFLRVERGAEASELTASGTCGAALLCVRVDAAEMSAQWARARAAQAGGARGTRASRAVVARWPGGTCRVDDDAVADAVSGAIDAGYRREVERWRREREARLTADGGWLTVAGLFWLKPGSNRFGADAKNDIVLPAHSAPPAAGRFVLEGGQVSVEVAPGAAVTIAGKPVSKAALKTDAGGAAPDVLALGALTMQIIARGDRLGVRLKDMRSQARRDFKGLTFFPTKPQLRISARFVAHARPTTMDVPTVIGTTERNPSPGYASFEIDGKRLRLDPVVEPGSDQLFFIFRDKTAGRGTYGGGRFLYADMPRDGWVVLDFNRAYSPPCAFTAHATCPLPPAQNRLPVAIEAGETFAGH
jgi:uncharacterized protein (DUF1684 family)